MFSDREEKVIKIIGKKSLTLGEIANELFDEMPLDSNIKVNNHVNRIIKKCEWHDLDWTFNKEKKDNKIVVSKGKK